MFDMAVADACEALGVSRARIHQLIKSGVLDAEKVGGVWLIDGRSVQARKDAAVHAGRPSKRSRASDRGRYMLMNRGHEVLAFNFDAATGDFFDADEIIDVSRAPFSVMSPRGKSASKARLSRWWAHRAIPKGRTGIEEKLAELGMAETYDLPFQSMGLSLSDQYWVKPYGSSIAWEDVNFFHNPFRETEVQEWLADVGLDSPDNTSDGVLSKRWVARGGDRFLLKGGSLLNQEPYNEVIATELFSRLLSAGDYVPYALEEWGDAVVSSCPCFIRDTEELIPAFYVREMAGRRARHDEYRTYVDACLDLGVADVEEALGKMLVCDFVLANSDRHWRNFGLVRDVETLEYRVAPLFDSGTSLWCRIPMRNLAYVGHAHDAKPFYEDARRQLRLVGDVPWLDLGKLSGFPEWAADFLEENPAMQGRTDFIFEGIQANIDRLEAIFG